MISISNDFRWWPRSKKEFSANLQTFDVPLMWLFCCYLVTLVSQGRRHSRYLLTSNSQRELLKEAGNEIDHGWVSSKLIHSFGEQLKSWKFNELFSRPGYASQHKQHQWQKTGHKVGKMCCFILYCSPKIKQSFERQFCQKPFQLFLNLFSCTPGLAELKVLSNHYQGHAWANKFKGGLKKRRFGEHLNI